MSTNRKIAKASVLLMGISVLGNLLSMGKEMLSAKYFGISVSMDAFNAALTIPNYVSGITMSIFTLIFIPVFVQYKQSSDPEEANRMASVLINYIFSGLALLAAVVFFSAGLIVQYSFVGFDAPTAALTVKLIRILCFSFVLSSIITILSSILNSYEHFFWPSASQIFITISTIGFIVFFSKTLGVSVFAWGLILGLIFQLIALIISSRNTAFKYRFDFNLRRPGISKTAKGAVAILMLALIGNLNPIINRAMASWLPQGSITALSYAEKLLLIPSTFIMASLLTAIFPFFSMQAADNKLDEMKYTLASSIKMSGFIYIPLSLTMMVFSKPTIMLLFQRGAFTAAATDLTSILLIILSAQLCFSYITAIMMRVVIVFQDMKTIVGLVLFNTGINVALNLLFIRIMEPPIAGIALSSTLGTFISLPLYYYILKKRMVFLHGLSILKSLSFFSLLALAPVFLMKVVHGWINTFFVYSAVSQFFIIAVSCLAGFAVYLGLAYYYKVEEAHKLYDITANKIKAIFKTA